MRLSAAWILVVAVGASVPVWLYSVGNPAHYLGASVPPGQLPYVYSKLAGLTALALIATQIMLAIPSRRPPGWTPSFHAAVGSAAVLAIALHIGLFFGAVRARTGNTPWHLLLPLPADSSYDQGLAIGAAGLLLIGALVPLGAAAYFGGLTRFIRGHSLVAGAIVLALLHAWWVGSEKQTVYAFAAVGAGLVVSRALLARRGKPSRA